MNLLITFDHQVRKLFYVFGNVEVAYYDTAICNDLPSLRTFSKHQFKYAVCRLKKAKDKIETDILVNLEIICGTLQMSVICEIDSLAPQIVKMA